MLRRAAVLLPLLTFAVWDRLPAQAREASHRLDVLLGAAFDVPTQKPSLVFGLTERVRLGRVFVVGRAALQGRGLIDTRYKERLVGLREGGGMVGVRVGGAYRLTPAVGLGAIRAKWRRTDFECLEGADVNNDDCDFVPHYRRAWRPAVMGQVTLHQPKGAVYVGANVNDVQTFVTVGVALQVTR